MINKASLVESNFDGMCAAFIEPVVNTEASEFMVNNLESIRRQVFKMGVSPDMVDDLIADVWLSIHEAELRGEGYDISHSNEDDVIMVSEFVYGRIKGYSQNTKYRSDVVEKKTAKDQSKSIEIISASCSDASDLDKLDGFQKAYALAASQDDIDSVEAEMSLRSHIEFCMEFDGKTGFKFINLLRNIEAFSDAGFNNSLFDNMKRLATSNVEFGNALKEVLSVAISNRGVFDSVVATF